MDQDEEARDNKGEKTSMVEYREEPSMSRVTSRSPGQTRMQTLFQ